MRKYWLIVCLSLFPALLFGQDIRKIKEDPSFVWGEGTGKDYESMHSAAVDALILKLSSTDLIDLPPGRELSIWKTFRNDVISVSDAVWDSGSALRYIPWKEVDKIFARRKSLAHGLYSRAAKAFSEGRLGEAATCVDWAMTLLEVLPEDKATKSSAASLRNRLDGTPATSVPGLSYVNREVEGIRSALGLKTPLLKARSSKSDTQDPKPAQASPRERYRLDALERLPDVEGMACATSSVFRGLYPKPVDRPAQSRDPVIASSGKPSGFSTLIMSRAAFIPSVETGAMLGIMKSRTGGYISCMSSFGVVKEDYTCMSDGQTGFGHIWASGRSDYSRFSVSGGILSEISGGLCLYAGAGYGRVGCFWEDVSGQWAKVKDKSFKGLMVESGVILTVWKIAIMTGVSSVSFSSLSPAVGVGVYF